jgi:MFS family permease
MSAPLPSGTGALVARCFLPFAAGYLMSYLLRGTNAVIAPQLSAEFGLTAADIGVLTSAYFAAFAAAQIPLGVLLDRFGPRRRSAAAVANSRWRSSWPACAARSPRRCSGASCR